MAPRLLYKFRGAELDVYGPRLFRLGGAEPDVGPHIDCRARGGLDAVGP